MRQKKNQRKNKNKSKLKKKQIQNSNHLHEKIGTVQKAFPFYQNNMCFRSHHEILIRYYRCIVYVTKFDGIFCS